MNLPERKGQRVLGVALYDQLPAEHAEVVGHLLHRVVAVAKLDLEAVVGLLDAPVQQPR